MSDLPLTLGICDYDHVKDLKTGAVKPEGIDLTVIHTDKPEDVFGRIMRFREWDVSEMSFGRYVSLLSQGANDFTAIPVFPSRVARLSAFYVPSDTGIADASELAGKRIGVPEWAQTATIYARGWLAEEAGVDLAGVHWIQTGVENPGRPEPVELNLPAGIAIERVTDRSLWQMALAGELDAFIAAQMPEAMVAGDTRVRRLFPDHRAAEEAYHAKTGIFPIMHVMVIMNDVLAAHPWAAMNLYNALDRAKNNSIARLISGTRSYIPVPWGFVDALNAQKRFGPDFWPNGLEPNRPTLEAFLRFANAQGVTHRALKPEDLFFPSTLTFTKT
jgi:4,5-dihydroxyphthalate decarboxylase